MAAGAAGSAPVGEGEGSPAPESSAGGGGAPGFRCLCPGGGGGAFNPSAAAEGPDQFRGFGADPRPRWPPPSQSRLSTRTPIHATAPSAPRSSRSPPLPLPRAHFPQAHLHSSPPGFVGVAECADGGGGGGLKEAVTSPDHRPGEGQRPHSGPPRACESQPRQSGSLEPAAAAPASGSGCGDLSSLTSRRVRAQAVEPNGAWLLAPLLTSAVTRELA